MLNRLRQPIALAVIAYLFITLVIMLPVTLHLNKMLFALPGDPYGTLYSLWQSRSAWPSMTFPNAPFLVTTTTILARIFGEVAAFNLILISGYVLTGLAGFLIGRKVAKNALAAFFVGLILMLSPYHVSRSLQHLGLANIEWLIFFIWSLLLFNENPKISRGALVGLFFSITMLDSYIYGLFAIVIILAYGLSALVQSACHYRNIVIKPTKIIGVMAGIVLAIALTVPPLLPVLNPLIHTGSSASQTVTSNRSFEELKVYGARWFAYVLPTPDSPIFGQYNEAKYTDSLGQSGSNLTELSVYLGWTTMLLAIFGLATLLLNKTNQETSVKFTLNGIRSWYRSRL